MRVFICHATSDKWVARQISHQLEALGAETFLDEKDIETGESIDEAIHQELKACDELLMLLSPVALQSSWVLIEIGGARALEKRLVPIMLHIGPNELPQPIRGSLARDLNDIEAYYEELRSRMERDEPIEEQAPAEFGADRPGRLVFSPGDFVQVVNQPQYSDHISGGGIGWAPGMDAYCGAIGQVLATAEQKGFAHLDVDGGFFGWAFEWLRPVPPETLEKIWTAGVNPLIGPLPSLEKMRRGSTRA